MEYVSAQVPRVGSFHAAAIEVTTEDGGCYMKKRKKRKITPPMDPNISDLPDPIAHHIMSFLPTLDVTKLSILSKRFFSLWASFPVIEFDQKRFAGTPKGTSDGFLEHVLHSVVQRKIDKGLLEFRVKADLKDVLADRRFDLALSMVLANGVQCVELNLGPHADYLLPAGFGSKSLNVLRLRGLQLDLCDVVQACPMLKTVCLTSCALVQDINFSSKTLTELEVCFCDVKSIKIDAPDLHLFVFSSSRTSPTSCQIDVLKCQKIMHFSLSDVASGSAWIEEHVNRLSKLKTFILNGCQDIEHIRVWNDKLQRVELARCPRLTSIELMAAALESFAYESAPQHFMVHQINMDQQAFVAQQVMPCNIAFLASKRIKDVSIKGARLITDQWLETQLAKMTSLEKLRLEACDSLKEIMVVHEKLQSLELLNCHGLVEAEIDTPQLASFMYHGNVIEVSKMVTQSNCTATLTMKPWDAYDNESFCRWRNMLSFFGHCKALKLICITSKEVMIPELHRERLVSPLYDLQHLEVQIISLEKIDRDLVDGLLWLSPLPKTLHVSSGSRSHNSQLQMIIKFIYSDMIEGEEDRNPYCCETKPIKCWKHHLKMLEIQSSNVSQKNGLMELQRYFLTNAKISASLIDSA